MTFKDGIDNDLKQVFFNADEFADEATYYENAAGNGRKVNVIFDVEHPRVRPETGELLGLGPALSVVTVDVPNLAHKDTFKINGVTYAVIGKGQDKGSGVTEDVELRKQ